MGRDESRSFPVSNFLSLWNERLLGWIDDPFPVNTTHTTHTHEHSLDFSVKDGILTSLKKKIHPVCITCQIATHHSDLQIIALFERFACHTTAGVLGGGQGGDWKNQPFPLPLPVAPAILPRTHVAKSPLCTSSISITPSPPSPSPSPSPFPSPPSPFPPSLPSASPPPSTELLTRFPKRLLGFLFSVCQTAWLAATKMREFCLNHLER